MRQLIGNILFAIADLFISAAMRVDPVDVPSMPEWLQDV